MGLKGIHDSNALWCFAGFTYCPWCRKIGQNEGTIINHLRTIHYKLGFICNQCYGCPMQLCWMPFADMDAILAQIKVLPPKVKVMSLLDPLP